MMMMSLFSFLLIRYVMLFNVLHIVFFISNFNSSFEVPRKCNQTKSAAEWQLDMTMTVSNQNDQIFYSLTTVSSIDPQNDSHFVTIRFIDNGSIRFSPSISHRCQSKDDCAKEFAYKIMFDIVNRASVDSQAHANELWPLLSSNLSINSIDLMCFDSNENLRQCGIATRSALCQITDQFNSKKKTIRTCENQISSSPPSITIYNSNSLSTIDLSCNRSLCNENLTLNAVKQILFKYKYNKIYSPRTI